ncbi:MAG TPA: LptF/LptG family permease [Phycisphaerales bacterium]|nr:LptF/LptG family permease [Phycisphaerales bacterium]
MSLLDRYIVRQYLLNILVLFAVLFAVIIGIDFSLNFDEYVKVADRYHAAAGSKPSAVANFATALYLVFDLWWPRLFLLYNALLGVILIGAMGFTCAQLNRHREFVAILAGGLSLHRVARPIVLAALGLVVLSAVNREFVIPRLAPLLTRDKGDAGSRTLGTTPQPLTSDAQGRLFYARNVVLDTGDIEGLWVWERDGQGLMTRRITAERAVWDGGKWVLQGGEVESRQGQQSQAVRPRREIVPVASLETDLDPTALKLRRFEGYANNLSTRDLSLLIENYKGQPKPPAQRIERYERVRWGRVAQYASTVLLLLVCLPFYIRREPGNVLVQTLMSAPVTLVGFVATMVGTSAAIPGLPPQLSVFIPVMVLIPLAVAAVSSIRT